MKVKICGLTRSCEAEFLNEPNVDYAGFVFYENSKRNVSLKQAKEIRKCLKSSILCVAVTVHPSVELATAIEDEGFDILQVHKKLEREVLEQIKIPIWLAVNIKGEEDINNLNKYLGTLPRKLSDKIKGIVLDGAEYGSGKPFDWDSDGKRWHSIAEQFSSRQFILAGGLTPENVSNAMAIFHPDVVDVSSGVEGTGGKDEQKIIEFVNNVKKERN